MNEGLRGRGLWPGAGEGDGGAVPRPGELSPSLDLGPGSCLHMESLVERRRPSCGALPGTTPFSGLLCVSHRELTHALRPVSSPSEWSSMY